MEFRVGNNSEKLEIYTLGYSLGSGYGDVGGTSGVISSGGFSGGNGHINLEGY